MKTKLTLITIFICGSSFAQMTIAERKSNYINYNKSVTNTKTGTTQNYPNKIISIFNFENYKKTISDKKILDSLVSQLKIKNISIIDSSSIKLNANDVVDLKKISPQIESEITEIATESTLVDTTKDTYYYEHYENLLSKAKSELTSLESSKNNINDDLESLKKLKSKIEEKKKKVIEYEKIIQDFDSIIYKKKMFPTVNKTNRATFFSNLYSKDSKRNNYLLNNVSAQIGNKSASVSSELIASYFNAFRVSFGTLISSSDESKKGDNVQNRITAIETEPIKTDETNAFQRLLSSGGGNIYLNIELPVYYLHGKTATIYCNANAKSGVVLTQFSKDINTATGNGNVGINLYGSISSDDEKSFIFFFNSNFGGYGGGTDFYAKLNLKENKIFAFGQVTLGLDIAKSIRISYTLGTFGSDESIRSKRGVVGIQLLKGLFD